MPDEPDDEILLEFLSGDVATSIGRIVSAWACFEYEVDELTWELARLEPEDGACLTAQYVSVVSRFNALIALARTKSVKPKNLKILTEIRSKAESGANIRNRIVHDPWYYGYKSDKTYRLQKTAKAKLDFDYKLVGPEELKLQESKIDDLRQQFRKIRNAILDDFWSR